VSFDIEKKLTQFFSKLPWSRWYPSRVETHQFDSSLKHRFEAEGQRKRNLKDEIRPSVSDRFHDNGIWFKTTFWIIWEGTRKCIKYAESWDVFKDYKKPLTIVQSCNCHKHRGRGFHTFVVTKPLKCQLIHPPMTIMGRTLVRLPFSMSVIIEGSVIGLGAGAARAWTNEIVSCSVM